MWIELEQPAYSGFTNHFTFPRGAVEKAINAFRAVANNEGTDVSELERTYTNLIQHLHKANLKKEDELEGIVAGQHFNENLFHTVVGWVMLQARYLFASELELFSILKLTEEEMLQEQGRLLNKKNPSGYCRLDIMVFIPRLRMAVITEMKYGDEDLEATTAEGQLDWYTDALIDRNDVDKVKRIAIIVRPDKSIQIKCNIINIRN